MSVEKRMRETSEYREWTLGGLGHPSIWLHSHVQLVLENLDGHVHIDLIAPFQMSVHGEVYDVDPGDKESLAPLVKLLRREAMSLVAYRTNDLILRFEDDCELRVNGEYHEVPELWETSGKGDFEEIEMSASHYAQTPWGEPLDYDHTKPPLPVLLEKVADVVILTPPQEVSCSFRQRKALHDEVHRIMEGQGKILLDVRHLGYAGSGTFCSLINLSLEAPRQNTILCICNANEHIVSCLHVLSVDRLVKLFETRDEALAALASL